MKKKTDQQIELLKQQIEDWKTKYLRALADYQNLERRHREEKADVHKFANEVLLLQFLTAIDTLKRAKDHVKDKGLDLAFKEFVLILSQQGVEEIQTVGKPFNPHEMECVEVAGGQDGIVVEETAPGYRLNGKILRVAKVKVGKEKSDQSDKFTNPTN